MILPTAESFVERILGEEAKCEFLEKAHSLPKIALSPESLSDINNLATGVYSPLEGFMGREDFNHVLGHMRLSTDLPWTIPIVLDVDKDTAASLKVGREVLLTDEAGQASAVLHLEEKYEYDREKMARQVFQTTDAAHPGWPKSWDEGCPPRRQDRPGQGYPQPVRVAISSVPGRLGSCSGEGLADDRRLPDAEHPAYRPRIRPEGRLTFVDGIFINPVIGKKKKGDYKDEVILASYEELNQALLLKARASWPSS